MLSARLKRFCVLGRGGRVADVLPYTPLFEEFKMQNSHRVHVGKSPILLGKSDFSIGGSPQRKQLYSYVAALLYKEVTLRAYESSGNISWAASVSKNGSETLMVDTEGKLRLIDETMLQKKGVKVLPVGDELVSRCKSTLPKESKSWLAPMIGIAGSCIAPTLARMEGQRMIDNFVNTISPPKPNSKRTALKQ